MTWEEMTPVQRDAWIAEYVMGHEWWKEDKGDYTLFILRTLPHYLWDFNPSHKFRDCEPWCFQASSPETRSPLWYQKSFPDYSTDIAAAFSMEDKIKERGLHMEYAIALVRLGSKPFNQTMAFDSIHASAEERCHAAYEVFKSL